MALWTCRDPACAALNKSAATQCEACSAPRRSGIAASLIETPNAAVCARCGDRSNSTTEFHQDDPEVPPSDRGVRLCPWCWVTALRRRAEGTSRDAPCPEFGCGKTAGEHIVKAKALASSSEWTERFKSRRGGPDPDEAARARLREQAPSV